MTRSRRRTIRESGASRAATVLGRSRDGAVDRCRRFRGFAVLSAPEGVGWAAPRWQKTPFRTHPWIGILRRGGKRPFIRTIHAAALPSDPVHFQRVVEERTRSMGDADPRGKIEIRIRGLTCTERSLSPVGGARRCGSNSLSVLIRPPLRPGRYRRTAPHRQSASHLQNGHPTFQPCGAGDEGRAVRLLTSPSAERRLPTMASASTARGNS